MKVTVRIKHVPQAFINDTTHKICPACGQPYLRVGQFGDPLFDEDVYRMICDNCNFTSPWASNDYGEAYINLLDWVVTCMMK